MRPTKTIYLLLATLVMMTSCISSSNSDTTLATDAAVDGFAIGTLKRTMHTKTATGADSTYTTTVNGASYSFTIDQIGHRIFNPDSLPIGTRLDKVTVSMTTYNNGSIYLRDTESDNLILYNSSDSIDFTLPRTYVIYSSDYKGSTEYTVTINVHQEVGSEFVWKLMDSDWKPEEPVAPVLPEGIKRIIGESSTEQYALSTDDRLMVSTDDGKTWLEDLLDDNPELVPTENVSIVSYPMAMTENTEYVLMVGSPNPTLFPEAEKALVWRKIIDHDDLAPLSIWTYMTRQENGLYQLPNMKDCSLVKYDDGVLAFGAPYNTIYQSRDNGITWKQNSSYVMPEGFDTDATKVAVSVDDDNFIWLHCSGTGQVWRGRLNKLGWQNTK